jgi:hypothetical protein
MPPLQMGGKSSSGTHRIVARSCARDLLLGAKDLILATMMYPRCQRGMAVAVEAGEDV